MNRLLLICCRMLLAFGLVSAAPAMAQDPVEGKDYVVIDGGAPLTPVAGVIVVEEFFNYICPACAAFEPGFHQWRERQPADVKVQLIPAAFRADFDVYARAYYAAEFFNIVEKSHQAVYDAVHVSNVIPKEGQKPDAEKVAQFYAQYGVSAADFLARTKSFSVDTQLRKATQYMKRVGVTGTPSVVVNGKYLIKARAPEDVFRTLDHLIAKERAARR